MEHTVDDDRKPPKRRSLLHVEKVEMENGRVSRVEIIFAENIGMVFGAENKNGKLTPVLIGKFHYGGRVVGFDELYVPRPWFNKAVRQAAAIIRKGLDSKPSKAT